MNHIPRPYLDAYLAGIGLGLVLLAAFVIAGRGLGASGAFSSVAAAGSVAIGGADVAQHPAIAPYITNGVASPLRDWLFLEIIGVIVGGFVSARLAGRFSWSIERGPHITDRTRLLYALAGGIVMGVGARLARGCTSGQALSGGALLSAGSWLFIATTFASAYALAPIARRLWR